MNSDKRFLLLVGSAKRPRSTSESLGTYLLERLRERGFEADTLLIHRSFGSDELREALLEVIDQADILVLAFPLYVDSLPSLLVRIMELMAARRRERKESKKQRLLAIVNCGFPEAHHNDTAIAICRRFAKEAGFEWAGGLALGGGEFINGRPLSEMGKKVRNVTRSLDLTAEALAQSKAASPEAMVLMAKPLVPGWMYTRIGGFMWKRRAKKHGVKKRLYDRPYQR